MTLDCGVQGHCNLVPAGDREELHKQGYQEERSKRTVLENRAYEKMVLDPGLLEVAPGHRGTVWMLKLDGLK